MDDIDFAARKLVEFESIKLRLADQRRTSVSAAKKCVEKSMIEYAGRRELWRDLNSCEWTLYQFTSLLHMLDELVEKTRTRLDTNFDQVDPVRHTVPKLVGIRHCIHHNGLVGLQVANAESLTRPVVGMPVDSVREHGNWGGNNPSFETFFHSVSGDFVVVGPLLNNSTSRYEPVISSVKRQIETEFGSETMEQATANVGLYD